MCACACMCACIHVCCIHVHMCVHVCKVPASCSSIMWFLWRTSSCLFSSAWAALSSHSTSGVEMYTTPLESALIRGRAQDCCTESSQRGWGEATSLTKGWAGVCPSLPKEGEQALVGDLFTLTMGGTSSGRSAVSRRLRCSSTSALPSRLHPYTTVEGNL